MDGEGYFTKLANDVLQAADQVAARLEDSISVIFQGDGRPKDASSPPPSNSQYDDNGDDMEEALRNNPLHDIADGVLGDIMKNQAGPSSAMEHFHSFRSAITWSEPFIQALVTFQIVMFLLSLYVSRRQRGLVPRLFTMAIIAITIRCSEYINGLAAENWSRFATQNYFDKNGVFMSVMVCCPLLLDSFIMLICFLREASQLLIQVKTIQLKKEQRRRQKQATVSENETNSKESGNGSGEASRRGKKYQ